MTSAAHLANSVMLPGFSGTRAPAWLAGALADGLAGVIYFAHNTPDAVTAAALSAQLRESRPDLIIATDEEGGDVTRLQAGTGSFLPGAQALGIVGDTALTAQCASDLGAVLRACGVTLDLAPCADITSNPANPVIATRSFGSVPDAVAQHVRAWIVGMHSAGVAACAKHFPGHGDTAQDSHVGLPQLSVSMETLRHRELIPFEVAIGAGVDAMMTGHLVVPPLGELPATVNPQAAALLRDMGFTGVIITDALDMGALGTGSGDTGIGARAVAALLGGADLLCLGTTRGRDDEALYRQAHAAVVAAIEDGTVDRKALERSIERASALPRADAGTGLAPAASEQPAGPPWREPGSDVEQAPPGRGGSGCSAEQARPTWHGAGSCAHEARPGLGAHEADCQPPVSGERSALQERLDTLERVGAQVARQAVSISGQPVLDARPAIVDLRQRFDHAAGSRSQVIQQELARRIPGARLVGAATEEVLRHRLQALALGVHPVLVITKDARPGTPEAQRLELLTERRRDITVLHAGYPAVAPDPSPLAALILTHGVGLANARAAADLLISAAQASPTPAAQEPAPATTGRAASDAPVGAAGARAATSAPVTGLEPATSCAESALAPAQPCGQLPGSAGGVTASDMAGEGSARQLPQGTKRGRS